MCTKAEWKASIIAYKKVCSCAPNWCDFCLAALKDTVEWLWEVMASQNQDHVAAAGPLTADKSPRPLGVFPVQTGAALPA